MIREYTMITILLDSPVPLDDQLVCELRGR
jgi:hypothetical protein